MSDDKTKEQSAIDIIYLLYDEVKFLSKQVEVLDTNIKLLNNKFAKFSKSQGSETTVETAGQPTAKAVPGLKQASQQKEEGRPGPLVLGNIKTYGYIQNKSKIPIKGVQVNIYNESGEVIKSKETDDNGYWEFRLPPGHFGVEYINKGFKPINFSTELKDGVKEYGVK